MENGLIYQGSFEDGMFQGYGTLYSNSQQIIKQGNWDKNKFLS